MIKEIEHQNLPILKSIISNSPLKVSGLNGQLIKRWVAENEGLVAFAVTHPTIVVVFNHSVSHNKRAAALDNFYGAALDDLKQLGWNDALVWTDNKLMINKLVKRYGFEINEETSLIRNF